MPIIPSVASNITDFQQNSRQSERIPHVVHLARSDDKIAEKNAKIKMNNAKEF